MLSGSLRLFCPSCDVGDILRPGWTVTTVRRRLNLSETLGVGQAVALRRMTEAAQRLVAAITHRSGT